MQENLMRVKVLCLGRSAKEINVNEGTTVEQAIAEAGFPKDSGWGCADTGTAGQRGHLGGCFRLPVLRSLKYAERAVIHVVMALFPPEERL